MLSRSISNSSSAEGIHKRTSASTNDTCGCTASGVPRTCSQCLNELLVSRVQCAISPMGLCINSASAESYAGYFNATFQARAAPGMLQHGNEFFADVVYCELTDSACARCGAQWSASFERDALRSASSFSCIGASGCICTAYCHLRATKPSALSQELSVGGETCVAPASAAPDVRSTAARKIALMRNVMALLLGAVVIALVVRAGIQQFHQQRFERRERARRRALWRQRAEVRRVGPGLLLEGWSRFREQLLEQERQRCGVELEPAMRTAAPTRIVVQQGEGFRPTSPSERLGTAASRNPVSIAPST